MNYDYVDIKKVLRDGNAELKSITAAVQAHTEILSNLKEEEKNLSSFISEMDSSIVKKYEDHKQLSLKLQELSLKLEEQEKQIGSSKQKYLKIVSSEEKKVEALQDTKKTLTSVIENLKEEKIKKSGEVSELEEKMKKEHKKLLQEKKKIENEQFSITRRIETAQRLEKKLQDKASLMGILTKNIMEPQKKTK